MKRLTSFEELARKVKQQEDTVVQLVKIVAATNHRISELQVQQDNMSKNNVLK